MGPKKLLRSNENKMICGVCGGISEYFNMDPDADSASVGTAVTRKLRYRAVGLYYCRSYYSGR